MCALHCAQLLHTILHRTDLTIFPLNLQTIIIAPMMSIWGKGTRCYPEALIILFVRDNWQSSSCHRANSVKAPKETQSTEQDHPMISFFLYHQTHEGRITVLPLCWPLDSRAYKWTWYAYMSCKLSAPARNTTKSHKVWIFTTTTPQPFHGPFSGTTWVSRCQKRTSGLYGARED